MTAHAMTGDRERCLAAGMDGYISKPIDQALLFEVVEEGSRVRRPGRSPSTASELMDRLGGDTELLAEVIGLFLDGLPQAPRRHQGRGRAAATEHVRSTAHALKGAAANIGGLGGLRSGADPRTPRRGRTARAVGSRVAEALDRGDARPGSAAPLIAPAAEGGHVASGSSSPQK